MSALLTAEEGEECKGNLSYLRTLYRLGVRMMTLTWNHENSLAFPNQVYQDPDGKELGVPDTEHGLKEKGFEFIHEMERLGMIIDVSHLSDRGFYDIYENTTKPFVASHSNARSVCGHCRNLSDDMIRKLAERGGVAGINYYGAFLMEKDAPGNRVSRAADMARHARKLADIGGMDCVGLGSDFDGIDGELEIKNASMMPLLEHELRRQGFHESEIEKIFCQNVLRVYREILS